MAQISLEPSMPGERQFCSACRRSAIRSRTSDIGQKQSREAAHHLQTTGSQNSFS